MWEIPSSQRNLTSELYSRPLGPGLGFAADIFCISWRCLREFLSHASGHQAEDSFFIFSTSLSNVILSELHTMYFFQLNNSVPCILKGRAEHRRQEPIIMCKMFSVESVGMHTNGKLRLPFGMLTTRHFRNYFQHLVESFRNAESN